MPDFLDNGTAAAVAMGMLHATVAVKHLGLLTFVETDSKDVERVTAACAYCHELARSYGSQQQR